MRALLRQTPMLALPAWVACGQVGDSASALDSAADAASTEGADDTLAPSSLDSGIPPTPVWWTLEGTLEVTTGLPDLATSEITLGLVGRELQPLCTTPRLLTSATPLVPGDAAIHAVWQIQLADGAGCAVPTRFELGLGTYDHQLDPALAASGLPVEGEALMGLYLREDSGLQYVMGIAGTPAQWAGYPAESPPLPDGAYRVVGLHLLPL